MKIPDELALLLATKSITNDISNMPLHGPIATIIKELMSNDMMAYPYRAKRARTTGQGTYSFPYTPVVNLIHQQAYRFAIMMVQRYGSLKLLAEVIRQFYDNQSGLHGDYPQDGGEIDLEFDERMIRGLSRALDYPTNVVKLMILRGVMPFSGVFSFDCRRLLFPADDIIVADGSETTVEQMLMENAEYIPEPIGANIKLLSTSNREAAAIRLLRDSVVSRLLDPNDIRLSMSAYPANKVCMLVLLIKANRISRIDRSVLLTYHTANESKFSIERLLLENMEIEGTENIIRCNAILKAMLENT